ncbi:MAG TPA: universal stress protein [Gaiellaceae bacterium]|nr:universal stress protein [Gaiellaceae bacterium]
MARKLPALERVLGAPALFSVAYGEIASSIYVALGIVAAKALGLTPVVLLAVGALFLVIALSYAEGTAAIPETGGAATMVRKAFNDLAGFMTGWVLFLDYLIVIALSALFLPHYLAGALQVSALRRQPWDVLVAVGAILAVGAIRLVRRPAFYSIAVVLAALDVLTQLLLVVLGFALLATPDALTHGLDVGSSPSWHALLFALPLAMLAYTGLETVANLAEEARRPGVDIPRSVFSAVALVAVVYVAIAYVGLSAFPVEHGSTPLGKRWLRAPMIGISEALHGHMPHDAVAAVRAFVGISGALILLASIATAVSGIGRLAYSLGEHGMLPRAFGRLGRRTHISPHSIVTTVAIASGLLVTVTAVERTPVIFLASLYSFGVLLAFAAAQLAVLRLRATAPDLARPYRVPLDVKLRGVEVPLPTLAGLAATAVVFVIAMVTHPAARYAGPSWLAAGVVVYGLVRRARGEGLLEHVVSPDEQELSEPELGRILVPLKLGPIGEEMLATAVKLAQERGSAVEALHVIKVPLDSSLEAPLDADEARAAESIEEARALGADHGVEVVGETIRARSIGEAIVDEARKRDVDLIVLGSAPRWRRQSRFFSPTVEYVLRKAPCEVLVVAFPQGVLDEAEEGGERGDQAGMLR